MTNNDIDRILADDEKITPSSGFLESVMEAVEREATAPQPLEFPWIRALPGFLTAIIALVVAIWNGIGVLNEPVSIAAFDTLFLQLTDFAMRTGIHWILLATAITIVSVTLPLSLMGVRKNALV